MFSSRISKLSLQQLQRLVESEIWKDDPEFVTAIFDRYIELTQNQNLDLTHFGTPEFWEQLLGNDIDEVAETEQLSEPSTSATQANISSDDQLDAPCSSRTNAQTGGAEDVQLDDHLMVSERYRNRVRRLNTEGVAFDLSFRNLDRVQDIVGLVRRALERLLRQAFTDGNENDRVGVQINHHNLDRPILVPFRKRAELTVDRILRTLEQVQQSNQAFSLDSRVTVIFTRITPPAGTGRHSFRLHWDEWISSKCSGHGSCLIPINNKDNLCLARALVVARAQVHKDDSALRKREWDAIRRGDRNSRSRNWRQRDMARELMADAGLANHRGPCGFEELDMLRAVMPGYRIKVFSKDAFLGKVYDKDRDAPHVLNLLHYDNHFCVMTSMRSIFDYSYYCDVCDKGGDHRQDHKCQAQCLNCLDPTPCPITEWMGCDDCCRWFRSRDCFDKHKLEEQRTGVKRRNIPSICQRIKKCPICSKTIEPLRNKEHLCGYTKCSVCKQEVELKNHKCYIEPIAPEKEKQKTPRVKGKKNTDKDHVTFIFFDFESDQDTMRSEGVYGNVYQHDVICCVSLKLCDDCKGDPLNDCALCGSDKLKVFKGTDTLDNFCKYLFSEQHKGCIAIAHNARGYDSQFLLNYLHRQAVRPKVITRGLELLSLEAGQIKVLDSLNFLPFPLAQFSKAFGLQETKGHYPFLLSYKQNADLDTDQLPDAWYFGVGDMKPEARDKFYQWYNEENKAMRRENRRYKLDEELVRYCKADVLLMARGCVKFRDMFIEVTNVDPFKSTITIASACSLVFRRNFLKKYTIGIVPEKGYRKNERQSVKAIKFLKWYSSSQNLAAQDKFIQHSANQSEFWVGRWKCDGLLRSALTGDSLNVVYEVQGCAFHGCRECFKDRTKILPNGMSAQDAYERTVQKRLELESAGYEVIEFWEHDIDQMLRRDGDMRDFFKNVTISEPMDPRDCFYGGRTNALKLYHECTADEQIHYADVCSLYPWVQKYGIFPVDHPQVLTDDFKPMTKDDFPYFGLIRCTVNAPRGLLHPVLPVRSHGKLCFPLCGICLAEAEDECEHTVEERQITGSWCTLEVKKALELGYTIAKVFEIYHYNKRKQYDGVNAETGLFTEYVNLFLKLKQQSSGWPSWCKTEDDKDKYIADYFAAEGVQLEKDKIAHNPALRQLSKLCLNSFWGKFGQRSNQGQLEYFNEPAPYFEVVCDPENDVSAVTIINENMVAVSYTKMDDFIDPLPFTSVVIAAFTTAQSRLKLYSYMEKLGPRLLYTDTDSILYRQKLTDKYRVALGDYLGMMTDELQTYGDGSYIQEFVSGGPKSYAYRVFSTKDNKFHEVCKLRGFTLTNTACNTLNFKSLKKLVKHYIDTAEQQTLSVVGHQIRRTRERQMVTRTFKKDYRVVYDKRVLLPSGDSRPFGY